MALFKFGRLKIIRQTAKLKTHCQLFCKYGLPMFNPPDIFALIHQILLLPIFCLIALHGI